MICGMRSSAVARALVKFSFLRILIIDTTPAAARLAGVFISGRGSGPGVSSFGNPGLAHGVHFHIHGVVVVLPFHEHLNFPVTGAMQLLHLAGLEGRGVLPATSTLADVIHGCVLCPLDGVVQITEERYSLCRSQWQKADHG